MGAEFDAFITVDESGFVLADHGMNSTLRDLGRVGLLVLNKGMAFDRQVVPSSFIEDMHAQPGDPTWPYESSDDSNHTIAHSGGAKATTNATLAALAFTAKPFVSHPRLE